MTRDWDHPRPAAPPVEPLRKRLISHGFSVDSTKTPDAVAIVGAVVPAAFASRGVKVNRAGSGLGLVAAADAILHEAITIVEIDLMATADKQPVTLLVEARALLGRALAGGAA